MKPLLVCRALLVSALAVVAASARAALVATPSVPLVTVTAGTALGATQPVTASGGTAPYGFTIAPTPLAALAFDAGTGALSGTLAPASLTPPFAGADDFSGDDHKWAYAFRVGPDANGLLGIASGRLEFTKAANAGSYAWSWDGDPTSAQTATAASYSQSWVADIAVTHTFATSANEFATMGFEVSDGSANYAAIMVGNNGGAWNVRAEATGTATANTASIAPGAAATHLRLSWDAGTRIVTAAYSTDGGTTYQTLQTFAPDTLWGATQSAGFHFDVFGNSNAAAAIPSGAMFADDFSVSAAAPTTYTVTVTDAAAAVASTTFTLAMNPPPPPTITGITPAGAGPGSAVVIAGANLEGATSLTFGGAAATGTYDAATQTIHATIPAAARSGTVVVTTASGASNAFNYAVALTITSQPSHNVVSTGQPVGFSVGVGGGAAGATYTYQWRRNGTAVGGATQAGYYVPAMSASQEGDYDVVVSDGTSTVISAPAALRTATPDLWTWRNRLPTGSDLNAIAYGSGRYVAVGSAGTILTSSDRTTWTPQPQRPPALFLNVASNGSTFVIVGTHGTILHSTDGLNWSEQSVGADVTLSAVAYGHGVWVVAGANGALFTSTDATSWTAQASGTGNGINGVTATTAGFLAVGSNGVLLTGDATAATWAATTIASGVELLDVAAANGRYVVAARTAVYGSADAATWTPATLPTTDVGIDWNRIVTTSTGFTVAGASYVYTSPTPKGYVLHSADGVTWTLARSGGPGLQGVASDGTGYVAVGLVGQILASADGSTWSPAVTGIALLGDFYAGASGPGGTIFAGGFGAMLRSADNATGWVSVPLATSANLYGATYWNGHYVVVGGNDNPNAGAAVILSSTDAATWSEVDLTGPSQLAAIAYDTRLGKYVAAGSGGRIYSATDPAGTWTSATSPTTNTLRSGTGSGGKYVLVGDAGTILYSTDGTNWSVATPVTPVSLQAVAFGHGRFVAVGSNTTPGAYRSVIVTSTDGITWQVVPVPYTGSLRGVTYADGRFTTVGGTSTILVSSDGTNWSADTSQFSGLFRALVRTSRGYLAAGTGGAIVGIDAPVATVPASATTVGEAGTPVNFTAVTVTGGHAPYSLALSPALPAGMTFDPATGVISGAPTLGGAAAPFAGSDDFATGSDAKWAFYFRTLGAAAPGNGNLSFTNSRLDFSKAAGAGSYFLGWDGHGDPATSLGRTTASFATSWVADISVTNTYTAAANEYADVGFQAAGSNAQYFAVLLLNRAGATYLRASGSGTTPIEAPVTATAVRLRLIWDAAAQTLTSSYSTDGGTTYATLATTTPGTTWTPGAATGGFFFEVFGESNAQAQLPAGALFADDFSVKATAPTTTLYSVTVTDAVGVQALAGLKITVAPAPVITGVTPATAPAGASVTITGGNLGNVNAVTFNGVNATSFTVDSATQITAVVPAGGTGAVAVQTTLGSSATSASGFSVMLPPTFLDAPTSRSVAAGATTGWFTSVAGTGPFTYAWSKDGVALPGATQSALVLRHVSAADAGTYTVRVQNPAGPVTSAPATLAVTTPDPVLWQQFTEYSTEQAPGRTVNAGGKVYVPWTVQDRIPDMVGGKVVGALARLNESDGSLDATFALDPKYRTASHLAVQPDGRIVIAVRVGDADTVIRTSDTGVVDTSFTAPWFARGIRFVTLQADGKVLVAATDNANPNAPAGALGASAPTVFRLNADGTQDSGFVPATLATGSVLFGAPVVDANGRIYLAGFIPAVNATARINLARLNADGSLDTSYADPANLPAGFASNQARAAVLQSDGRAVFVGDFRTNARGTASDPIMAIRLNADGTWDSGFAMPLRSELGLGTAGIRLRAAVVNADDTLVAVSDRLVRLTANGAVDPTFIVRPLSQEAFWVSCGANGHYFVPDVRGVAGAGTQQSVVGSGIVSFATNGTPDLSFWTGGWGRVAYPANGAVLSDGRVWVAGEFNRFGGAAAPGLAQFGADGALGSVAVASTRSMTYATLAPASSDRIYAVLGSPVNSVETAAPTLVRLAADGTVDSGFTPSLPTGYDLNAAALHAEPDGGLLLAQAYISDAAAVSGTTGSTLLRLNADGSLDASYTPNLSSFASVERDTNNVITRVRTGGLRVMQVLPDGGALVAAAAVDGTLRLLRLTATGAEDSSFAAPSFGTVTPAQGYTGVVTDPVTHTTGQFPLSVYDAAGVIQAAVQSPNGKVYVGGRFQLAGAPAGLVRLNADGSLDATFTGAGMTSTGAFQPNAAALAADAAGRIYVAGRFDAFNGTTEPGIFRLGADGTLDTGWSAGFAVRDVPRTDVSLVASGEKLYAFGTVSPATGSLPTPYRVANIPLPLVITQPPVATTVVVGNPLSLSVSATSTSTISYQWSKAGSLITGATTSTLTIGSAALADEGLYTVALTNAAGTVTTTAVQVTVNAPPAITQQPANATVVVGTPATFTVAATGKPAVAFQWFKGTTAITGATNATLSFASVQDADAGDYTVRVTNSVASVTSTVATLTVHPVAPLVTSPLSATAIAGRSFSYGTTTNATPATFSASGLPPGLTIDSSTGVITGVPTSTGAFAVTLSASNVTATDTRTLNLTVNSPPPVINSAASATATAGAAFTYTIAAVNTPTSFAASGLPAGLTIDAATGVISGTASSAGTFEVTLTAANAGGTTSSPLVLTVDPAPNAPAYAGATQLSGVQNSAFAFTPTFSTGGISTTYTATGLPTGLTIDNSTGAISGTPTVVGTFTVPVTATNSAGVMTVPFTLTVNPPPAAPAITSTSTAAGVVGTPFSFHLTASGAPTSFAAAGLPALGLSLDPATGVIAGTPTAPGTLTLQVNAANGSGTGGTAVLLVTVAPASTAPIISSTSAVQGRAGDPLSYQLTAANNATSFAITAGALPAGLALDPATGAVNGTPTQAGQFSAWFAGTNSSGQGYAVPVLFSISPAATMPAITSNGTAAAQVGQPFAYQITATNSPTGFTATGLPSTLTLDPSTGLITGTPSDPTTSALSVTLTATNASGTSEPKALLLTIAAAPATPVITSPLAGTAQVGATFSYTITASDGATSFAASGLPAGLALDATTGVISGTPLTAGTASVALRAANPVGLGASSSLVLSVMPPATAPAITSAAAAGGKVGVAFSYTATANATVTSFAVTGTLPLGLALNTSTGVISGTPAAAGVATVQLTATGPGGTSLPQSLVLNISPPDNVPVITSPIYASATVGEAFTYTITAASTPAFPSAPFATPYTLDAAGLPAGLSVNPSTGVIEGRPTATGVFTVSLVGTNPAGTGQARDLTIFVSPAATAPTVTSTPFAAAQVGVAFTYQITASNRPTSYEVLGAPAWMTINASSGICTGFPTTPGTFAVQLVASNDAGSSAPVDMTLTVAPSANAPVVTSSRTAVGTVAQPFRYVVTASVPSGAPAVTAFVATGLPPGLGLDLATGVISGTPTTSGQFEVTLLARNSAGESQPVTLVLNLQSNLQFNGGL